MMQEPVTQLITSQDPALGVQELITDGPLYVSLFLYEDSGASRWKHIS